MLLASAHLRFLKFAVRLFPLLNGPIGNAIHLGLLPWCEHLIITPRFFGGDIVSDPFRLVLSLFLGDVSDLPFFELFCLVKLEPLLFSRLDHGLK